MALVQISQKENAARKQWLRPTAGADSSWTLTSGLVDWGAVISLWQWNDTSKGQWRAFL